MQNLNDFTHKIDGKFAADEERIRANQQTLNRQHKGRTSRLGLYVKLADQIIKTVIRPRGEKLVSYFKNASLSSPDSNSRELICRFETIPRFPASATFGFLVSHDADIKKIDITFSLQILPIFMSFDKRDALSFPLDELDESQLSEWVENKFLYFLDTYLKLEHHEQYQKQNLVHDPVCGTQVNKAFAITESARDSQSYYFCTEDCRAKFISEAGRLGPSRPIEDDAKFRSVGSEKPPLTAIRMTGRTT